MESSNMVNEYCKLLNKHDSKYLYMKKKAMYSTSLYLTNKTGQHTFNFYAKEAQQISKLGNCEEKYKDILRLEVHNRVAKLKSQEKLKNIAKIIDNYFTEQGMRDNYFKLITSYLYLGDYYKLSMAKKLINKSDYSKKWKEKLKKFLTDVSKYGSVKNVCSKGIICQDTAKVYIQKLNTLHINPITIDEDSIYSHLTNLVTLALETSEEKYFK